MLQPAPLASHFLLDPDVTFLNHGSYGACPKPVFAAYQDWQLKLERQPVAFLDPLRGYGSWLAATRSAVATLVGAAADDVVGVQNATAGLNIVAHSLPLQPGDEILTTDHEYAALEKTWALIARRTGAVIKVVNVPLPLETETAFTDAVIAGMTDRTRVLFLSHITSPTALVFPVGAAVAEARKRDIWSVIDGAHAPGHIPLNLDELGADFYSGNCHKWLMAPKGAAFLHVRKVMQHLIEPLVVSHGWTPDKAEPGPFGGTPFVDAIEFQGTRDPAAWLTVPEAIRFMQDHHWPTVAQKCQSLAQETAARLGRLTGLPLFSTPEFCAPQMVAMPVPRTDTLALHDRLINDYGIEIPCFDWAGKHSIVRVSVQGYNTEAQMTKLIDALAEILQLR